MRNKEDEEIVVIIRDSKKVFFYKSILSEKRGKIELKIEIGTGTCYNWLYINERPIKCIKLWD